MDISDLKTRASRELGHREEARRCIRNQNALHLFKFEKWEANLLPDCTFLLAQGRTGYCITISLEIINHPEPFAHFLQYQRWIFHEWNCGFCDIQVFLPSLSFPPSALSHLVLHSAGKPETFVSCHGRGLVVLSKCAEFFDGNHRLTLCPYCHSNYAWNEIQLNTFSIFWHWIDKVLFCCW